MTEPAAPADRLVVDPEYVARRAGIPIPMDGDTEFLVCEAIADAQSAVEAYLGRPVMPGTYVESRMWPGGGAFDLAEQPVLSVVSEVEETDPDTGFGTGMWTVTYTAGLDGRGDPALGPIRRYVVAHALHTEEMVRLRRRFDPQGGRVVKSLSAEGQSVSYSDAAGFGAPGAASARGVEPPGGLPTLVSLDRWRLAGRRVYQRRDPSPLVASHGIGWSPW